MSKTDSVAVLRERQINELVKLADDVWHQRIEQEDIRGLVALILDLKPDAALSAQGEPFCYAMEYPHVMTTIDYIHAPDFVKRLARAEQLRDGCEREYGEPAKITPLYLHPAPPGSDAVTDWTKVENVAVQYVDDYEFMGEDENGNEGAYQPNEGERTMILDAMFGLFADPEFQAALAARTGKGEA